MESGFLSITEVSKYLGIKNASLYAKVERKEIPHYRFGRLIKFKKNEIDSWVEEQKVRPANVERKTAKILRTALKPKMNIDRVVKRAVAEVKGNEYTSDHGKSDQIKGLRKEVTHGAL